MPRNPAPLVTTQDLLDAIQEAIATQDQPRIKALQTELSQHHDQIAAARSLERNGMNRHTKELVARLGYRVTAI